jgi:hypothetical protein
VYLDVGVIEKSRVTYSPEHLSKVKDPETIIVVPSEIRVLCGLRNRKLISRAVGEG